MGDREFSSSGSGFGELFGDNLSFCSGGDEFELLSSSFGSPLGDESCWPRLSSFCSANPAEAAEVGGEESGDGGGGAFKKRTNF